MAVFYGISNLYSHTKIGSYCLIDECIFLACSRFWRNSSNDPLISIGSCRCWTCTSLSKLDLLRRLVCERMPSTESCGWGWWVWPTQSIRLFVFGLLSTITNIIKTVDIESKRKNYKTHNHSAWIYKLSLCFVFLEDLPNCRTMHAFSIDLFFIDKTECCLLLNLCQTTFNLIRSILYSYEKNVINPLEMHWFLFKLANW